MLVSFAAALAAAQPAMSPPADTTAPRPSSSARVDAGAKQAAINLAQILHPEQSQIAAAERMLDTQIAAAFRANTDFQTLEREYPGFIDAMVADMKPVTVRYTRASLPDYYDRVAELIASRFTRAEIEDLTRFYLSPTGRKVTTGVAESLSMEAVLAEMMTDPDKPTSLSAVAADHQATREKIRKLIDKSDEAALLEFVKKPYFARVAALGPAMRKLDQDYMNEPAPEFEKEIEAVVEGTLARFEAAKK